MRSRALAGREASLAARRACILKPQRVDNAVYIVTNREAVKSIISYTDLYRSGGMGPARPNPGTSTCLRLSSTDSPIVRPCRVRPGDAPEYRAVGEAGPTRVVEIENPADQL